MIIFIDESGDPGFKAKRGSSKTFVIALVIFDEELDAEETALKIKKLRKTLGKTDKFEFKFNKCSQKMRLSFLNEVKTSKFRVRAIVFNKESIYSQHLRNSKDSFYNFALRQVLEHNNHRISHAKIRLDGKGERLFRQKLTVYLRKQLNSESKKIMSNLRFRDSQKDVLIQLADTVAGSIRRDADGATEDCHVYREVIKQREEDIWLFK